MESPGLCCPGDFFRRYAWMEGLDIRMCPFIRPDNIEKIEIIMKHTCNSCKKSLK